MSAQVKSYFLAPTWDYPPDGPLKLGNIIISPSQPVPALASVSTTTAQNAVNATTSSSCTGPSVGFRSTKNNVSWSREKHLSGQLGVWTSFLQSVGVDVGLEMSRGSSELFEFEQMITQEHYPSDDELRHAVSSSPRAVQFIQRHSLRRAKRLYVVVGIKTVTGARVVHKRNHAIGVESQVSADGLAGAAATAAGLPVSLGPSMGLSKSKSDEISFEGSDNFVFAYRVRRINMSRDGDGVDQEDYRKGALYSHRSPPGDDSERDQSLPAFSVLGLEEDDFAGAENDLETRQVIYDDDGAEVVVVNSQQ